MNMNQWNLWKEINKKDLQVNKKPIWLKWVFTLKDDGDYKDLLVAMGFIQIPGV